MKIKTNLKKATVGGKFQVDGIDYVIHTVITEDKVVLCRKEGVKNGRSKTFNFDDVIKTQREEKMSEKSGKKKDNFVPSKYDSIPELLEAVRELTNPNHKILTLENNMSEELRVLLSWTRKSEPARGISGKRLVKASQKFSEEEIGTRPAVFTKKIKDFVDGLTSNEMPIRYELTKSEKLTLLQLVPVGMEEIYGAAIGRGLKLGISDKNLTDLIK